MPRTNFPSPANIRRQTIQERYGRQAQHLFNNLAKDFEKQASINQPDQTVTIRRRTSYGNAEAAWITRHFNSSAQRQFSIDYCNSKLVSSGWQITGFEFTEVDCSGYWPSHGRMTAIVVNMEYTCDDACAAK
jgi:hypothetical protein|tara:strand:- start:1067 stop:1462 length:396 start_codon:yes stop_codon:yes gene_type:complete